MDSPLTVSESSVDAVRLSDWIAAAPISRATAYELLKGLGIEPHRGRVPGVRSDVAILDSQQLQQLEAAAARVAGGERVAEVIAAASGALVPSRSVDSPQPPPDSPQPGHSLNDRLEALERAVRTGAPLTTAEVSWLLGARPGAASVTRGRVTATRHGRNVWSLSADGP